MRIYIPVLLEAVYASWAAQDLEATLECFADEVVFLTHVSPKDVPYAGTSRGKTELRRQLQKIIDIFEFIEYRPVQIRRQRGAFHCQVRMQYRHRATGLTYEGSSRHVWRIRGGKITRFETFHDPERIRAFFELIALYEKPKVSDLP